MSHGPLEVFHFSSFYSQVAEEHGGNVFGWCSSSAGLAGACQEASVRLSVALSPCRFSTPLVHARGSDWNLKVESTLETLQEADRTAQRCVILARAKNEPIGYEKKAAWPIVLIDALQGMLTGVATSRKLQPFFSPPVLARPQWIVASLRGREKRLSGPEIKENAS